jgi:prophage regulatory protein
MIDDNQTRFERLPQVKQRFGKSTAGIYADMAKGKFPLAVKIGANAVAWRVSDLEAFANALPVAQYRAKVSA